MYRPSVWDDDYVPPVQGRAVPGADAGYNRQSWDDSDSGSDLGDSSDGDDAPGLLSDSDSDGADAKPASTSFVEEMVDLLLERTLNARHFCTLMHLVGESGPELQRKCKKLGKQGQGRPRTGHFERHCKRNLGPFMDEASTGYRFTMPGRNKHSAGRAEHTIHASAVHEELDADLRNDQSIELRLEEAIADRQLPPIYCDHPIVKDNPDKLVLPFNLFIDGVPYSHTDGVIGFWLINVVTGRRYLFLVVRKKLLCECGCKGWCTFHAVFKYINWFLTAMARKAMPLGRHDNQPWDLPLDAERTESAGYPLRFRIALLFIKGDWAEYASTLGFPPWNDSIRPCFACNAELLNMYPARLRRPALEQEWRPNEQEDYFVACQRCEMEKEIPDVLVYLQLKAIMRFDKKGSGVKRPCFDIGFRRPRPPQRRPLGTN